VSGDLSINRQRKWVCFTKKSFASRAGAPDCRSDRSLKEHTPFGRSVRHKEPGAELLEMAAKFNPFWNVQ
jgi:hypothetical protein